MNAESDHSALRDVQLCPGEGEGPVLVCAEGLSFWGGVDPQTGQIIDVHHPDYGSNVAGKILLMPTSRGSCSGSGVLLQLSLNGLAPAALVFCEAEEVLTLGALVCGRLFDRPVPVLRLCTAHYQRLAREHTVQLRQHRLVAAGLQIDLHPAWQAELRLSERDQALLAGEMGPAAQVAMEVVCQMAAAYGVDALIDVTRGHIDGCILAHDANLIFAERMAGLGARVAIPTTINAISVDRENWRNQGVSPDFGGRASRLADAYVAMGARPTFSCAPYLLDDPPRSGECLGWSESNAVIYANSVLAARTPKHPDYLDLFIAITGRAPAAGVYQDAGRIARTVLAFELDGLQSDESLWPLVGWLAGKHSPDQIPLLIGLETLQPTPDDLKALCAAFGTTSGAPMLHIRGHTPEAGMVPAATAPSRRITRSELADAWRELNRGQTHIDLVAIGSPHVSLAEVRQIIALFAGRRCRPGTRMIVTIGRDVMRTVRSEGLLENLEGAGVQLVPDLCWCSIREPVFPPGTTGLMTNSGKYAHYAHGLSGVHARLGSLASCVEAAVGGRVPGGPPVWLVPGSPGPT
ncbi:MAG: aconitase family protein [Lamprobacter sp.]|uniref:cis-3-hydroxy-L-proline dehydratase n=1 Tax=Lamprobacter sp. TaxID=3100796 RepID=UPI002B25E53F|nr:aconitase family protein [Lamprobacter sp.]MEA3643478.1 aconitase family protein [Lamprobacter sp.]